MTSPIDTLTSADVTELLGEKYILILGDSVVRGLYKDLIKFSHSNDLLTEDELRIKGEHHFYGDRLVQGGIQKGLTNGLDYEEVREYTAGGSFRIRFYFLTRSYSTYMKDVVFNDMKNQTIKPDIILMNSCLWDVSRYGIHSMRSYQQNIDCSMGSLRQMFPDALFLWLSALPVSNSSKGGFIVARAEYIRPILPGLIRDGNYHCSQMCDRYNILYIDFHTIFSTMLHLRRPDGIHWSAIGTRLMNEMILNHLKAYYHGVKDLQCPLLRGELGNKIRKLKERMKESKHHSKTNYFARDISNNDSGINDMEISPVDEKRSVESKRKRYDEDEKENDRYYRKVISKSPTVTSEQRMIIMKKLTNDSAVKQVENQFDHQYCDIMYDNEYEGLQLAHFASYDLEPSDEIDIEPSKDRLLVPLTISDGEEKIHQPDYIVLSSDDEDEIIVSSSSLSTAILPIYLLNHL